MRSEDQIDQLILQLRLVRNSIQEDIECWERKTSGAFSAEYITRREEQLQKLNFLLQILNAMC